MHNSLSSSDEQISRGLSATLDVKAARTDDQKPSTLIEFPGVSRNVPEWRRQLSQRVREVQERRAREAAEAAAEAQAAEAVSCALPSGQLELVPDRDQPAMNPIVSKALERVDRARRTDFNPSFSAAATAPALADAQEPLSETEPEESKPNEVKHKLSVVASPAINEEPLVKPKPVRLIADGMDDSALSYLENCLSARDVFEDVNNQQASFARRFTAGVLDVLLVVAAVAPVAAALGTFDVNWRDPSVLGLTAGIALALLFFYLTVSTALTGRTLGKRLCSLRIIDRRTRLIPTGGQSIKRAVAFVFSLALGGFGIIYALVDRDGRTVHDRFSNTMVVRE